MVGSRDAIASKNDDINHVMSYMNVNVIKTCFTEIVYINNSEEPSYFWLNIDKKSERKNPCTILWGCV